jgi:hypothetical protein
MSRQLTLDKRIEQLEARNRRVEGDKGWETSWTRRLSIMLATYVTVAAYLHFVIHIKPWINALVPVIGYTFSTLTLPQIKKRWLSKHRT